MASKPKLGRPPIPVAKRRFSQSVTLDPPVWKKVDGISNAHGVTRSQIFDDALKHYFGELEDMLRHLREELSSQQANTKQQEQLIKALEDENKRLKASQQMVDSILSPYGGPTSELSKENREKARTLRAIKNNPNNLYQVQMLMEGKISTPETPIIADAFRAWGSWQAIMDAIKAAEAAE